MKELVKTMPKNSFAKTLQAKCEKEYSNGVWHGLLMGLDIVTIALNHKFNFGAKRIEELESYVQELINDIVKVNDPELTKHRLKKAIKQIRGEDYGN